MTPWEQACYRIRLTIFAENHALSQSETWDMNDHWNQTSTLPIKVNGIQDNDIPQRHL